MCGGKEGGVLHPKLLRTTPDLSKILSENLPNIARSVNRASPTKEYSSFLLLQYKQILNRQQKDNLNHTTYTVHKNAHPNGLYVALLRNSL